jgi:hypothetical protein
MGKENGEKPQFGLEKRPEEWEEYLGKYVIISYPAGTNNESGQLVEFKGGYGILSPFIGVKYVSEKKRIRVFSNKRTRVPIEGAIINPTTRKSLENFCKFQNLIEEKRVELEKNTSKESTSSKS